VTNEIILRDFKENGFIVFENLIDFRTCDLLRLECESVLSGVHSTGLTPDKVKWRPQDALNIPRSVCNAWKSSYLIHDFVVSNPITNIAKLLMGWQSIKLNQDSIIFMPKNAGSVTMHQDNSYQDWHLPGGVVTAWISLGDCDAGGGGLEYVLGSHKWTLSDRVQNFTSSVNEDYQEPAKTAALKGGYQYNLIKPIFKKGSVGFHHGKTFHGSNNNSSNFVRGAYAIHLMDGDSIFSDNTSPFFHRYKLGNSIVMHDSFFPLLG
jgi:ectoine hydroxylase-related dioxygenase (phytanoyl-CoA dioxygenase family)